MSFERILTMLLNAFVRVLVNRAVNAAFWFATRFRRSPPDQPPAADQPPALAPNSGSDRPSRDMMKRARQTARLMRRLGR